MGWLSRGTRAQRRRTHENRRSSVPSWPSCKSQNHRLDAIFLPRVPTCASLRVDRSTALVCISPPDGVSGRKQALQTDMAPSTLGKALCLVPSRSWVLTLTYSTHKTCLLFLLFGSLDEPKSFQADLLQGWLDEFTNSDWGLSRQSSASGLNASVTI
jgi:hypothetical protein